MQKNYNENLVAGAAIRDDKGRRISKLFEATHPKMTVGYAKNLIMPNDPTEQEFNFRQAGGGVIEDGVAVIDKVKGNTVVWNQWEVKQTAENSSEEWINDKMFWGTKIVSGSLSFNEDSSIISYSFNDNNGFFRGHKYSGYIVGHKYVILVNAKANTSSLKLTNGDDSVYHSGSGNWELMSLFFTAKIDSYDNIGLRLLGETSFPQAISQSQWKTIDLTQMFGAGNEPTTVEEFLSRKPKVADEYAYNEGTIINNKVEGIKTSGINLWDEEWNFNYIDFSTGEPTNRTDLGRICSANFIKVDASKQFYFKCNSLVDSFYIHCYDANKNWLGVNGQYFTNGQISTITIPNTAYVKFAAAVKYGNGTTYNHDICINLSDPSINGQYFPYEKHELDLSWVKDIKDTEGVKLFEDGMKSAGTAFDEAWKNKAVKRLGVKVFDGNVAIARGEISGDAYRVLFTESITTSSNGLYNMLASNGDGVYAQYNGGYFYDKYAIGFASVNTIWFCLPSSVAQTISQVSAYLEEHPITFIYELAEPIEVEYDEKNLTYPVIAGGTEEAIASEPSSAFRADIGYGIDAVKTILDLKARVEALEGK